MNWFSKGDRNIDVFLFVLCARNAGCKLRILIIYYCYVVSFICNWISNIFSGLFLDLFSASFITFFEVFVVLLFVWLSFQPLPWSNKFQQTISTDTALHVNKDCIRTSSNTSKNYTANQILEFSILK